MIRILIIYMMLHCIPAKAQHVIHSVEDVWKFAIENNAMCKVYQLKTLKAHQEVLQVQSQMYPAIGVNVNGQANFDLPETPVPGEFFGQPNETMYLSLGNKFQYTGGVSVSKKLFDWHTHYQSKLSTLNYELSIAENQYFIQTLKEQLAVAYYMTLTSKFCAQSLLTEFQIADSIFQITNDRFKQGLIDDIVLNQAKIKVNQVAQQKSQMEHQLFQNINLLRELSGFNLTDTLMLDEDITLVNHDKEFYINSNTNYLKLKELQHQIAIIEVKKNVGNFLPKLELYSFMGYRQYQEKFRFSVQTADFLPETYVGFSLSVPIFTGFSSSSKYQNAVLGQKIAKLNLQDAERTSNLSNASLNHNIINTKYISEKAKESTIISAGSLQLANYKYKIGIIDLEAYLKVFDSHLDIENQYFEYLANFLILNASALAREKQ
jgi:outer membrane protein